MSTPNHLYCTADRGWVVALFLATSIMAVALPAWGQPRGVKPGEVIELAPAVGPSIHRATAVKENGKVVIHLSAREALIRTREPEDKEGKDWIDCWTKQDSLVLDEQIRAYNPSGERLSETTVLKALEKPVTVVCFERTHKNDPETPDSLYTQLFRDDVVILVMEAKYWLR